MKLTPVSGCGGKGPACFVVEADGLRLMLDLGYGPQPGRWPDLSGVGDVDALLVSHGHADHAGAMSLLPQIGSPPVYATETVGRMLPGSIEAHPLPLHGSAEVLGVRVRTGRSGHAPGGIWIHLDLGDGVLYMGDHSTESALYAYDAPPQAATIVLDASYGDYSGTLADCQRALEPLLVGDALLPVPEGGRGPEIALYLERGGRRPHLDEPMRASLKRLSGIDRDCLRDGTAALLAELAAEAPPIDGPHGLMLASRADATGGEAGKRVAEWEHSSQPAIVFTGYVPPGTPAERLTLRGRARYSRWNVHPRLADNAELVRATGARVVMPAFGVQAFSPARVVTSETLLA